MLDLTTLLVNTRRIHTRRLVGFDVERGDIDGVSVCRMFNRAIVEQSLPKRTYRAYSAATKQLINLHER